MQARQAGAVPKLTSLLKRYTTILEEQKYDDEQDLISSIISACSGPMATSTRLRALSYRGIPITVKEGALGDGVGAKVWTVAHVVCHEMVLHPGLVLNKTVLEIGAGCGACGLLAAKLGASQVDISDYVDVLLLNLRDAMHLNASAVTEVEVDELFDPEGDDVSECSDLDGFFAAATTASNTGNGEGTGDNVEDNKTLSWQRNNVAIRFLDWADSIRYLDGNSNDGNGSYCALDGASSGSVAPCLPDSTQYDLVLGTDILYEWNMTESVAAAIAHRLKPGGKGLVCNAVRDQKMFDAMVDQLKRRGLRVGVNRIEPLQEDGGVAPHDQPYEGGFVLVAVEHERAPADDWHRDDLFSSSS